MRSPKLRLGSRKAVVNLVQLSSERKLVAVMPVRDFGEESLSDVRH
jgi:hypothetical protein